MTWVEQVNCTLGAEAGFEPQHWRREVMALHNVPSSSKNVLSEDGRNSFPVH